MSKVTAVVPSNIAFIKYWGARDLERAVPTNPSISMTLSECVSSTTVEFLRGGADSSVYLADAEGVLSPAPRGFALAVERHLGVLAAEVGTEGAFTVATRNSFPSAAGIASSASGFAALATAAAGAVGVDADSIDLSRWARLGGSGSAARSVLGGYVEWPGEANDPKSASRQLHDANHWLLCDIVAVVDDGPKGVSSRDGHRRAPTSPYYDRRQELLPLRLTSVRQAIAERDLAALGPTIEAEAVDLHLIAMSSDPPIHYWRPGTVSVLTRVRSLREGGVEVYSTMDAGPNVHLICEPHNEVVVVEAMKALPAVQLVIPDRVGAGPSLTGEHLF